MQCSTSKISFKISLLKGEKCIKCCICGKEIEKSQFLGVVLCSSECFHKKFWNDIVNEKDIYTPYDRWILAFSVNDLTYKKNTLDYNISNHYIEIEDDFYVISQKCTNQVQAKKTADLRLSFRQISTFRQLDKIIKFGFISFCKEGLL